MKPDRSMLTAQQLSYELIRERILDGTFPGGGLLKPHVIAKELNISRIPVREALQQLAAEGLVTLRPNRTAIVTTLTISEISDLFDMRAALEALTAPAITQRIDGTVLAELEELRIHMDEARRDSQEWVRRHAAFHDYLLGLCDRPRLATEILRLRTAIQPLLLLHIDIYNSTEMPGYEHQTLLSALATRNTTLIEMCLREHVLSAGRGLLGFLAMHPGLEKSEPPAANRRRRSPGPVAAAQNGSAG